MKRILVLLLIYSQLSQASVCRNTARLLSYWNLIPSSVPGWIHAGTKAVIFPAYFLPKFIVFDVVIGGSHVASRLLERITKEKPRPMTYFHGASVRKDILPALAFLGLALSNSTAIPNLSQAVTNSQDDLIPKDFFKSDGKAVIVGVNSNMGADAHLPDKNNDFRLVGDYFSGKEFADEKNVFHRRADSVDAWLDELLKIHKAKGPIEKLVLDAHGLPGLILIGKTIFDEKWVENNREKLAKLPRDLFAKDATVVLISCSVAATQGGQAQVEKLFKPILKQGGNVIASTKLVLEKHDDIPEHYRNGNYSKLKFLLEKEGAALAGIKESLAREGDYTFSHQRIAVIQIPPQQRATAERPSP